jgi:hypothetical protein
MLAGSLNGPHRHRTADGGLRTPLSKCRRRSTTDKENAMTATFTLALAPLISLIAGILILVIPRLLNYIVAIYLILIGILGLFNISL